MVLEGYFYYAVTKKTTDKQGTLVVIMCFGWSLFYYFSMRS